MGAERRSMIISDAEKKITAIHEAGHAMLTVHAAARRSDPQGHDHSARHGARPHAAAAGRREAQLLARLPERSDRHPAGRPHRRRDHARQITTGAGNDLERATEMARTHGLRVGHERRDGPAHVRQEGRADLPRPRDRAAVRLQRRHGASGSTRRSSGSSPTTTSGRTEILEANRARLREHGRRAARCARCSTATRCGASSPACRSRSRCRRVPTSRRPRRPRTGVRSRDQRPAIVPPLNKPLPQE